MNDDTEYYGPVGFKARKTGTSGPKMVMNFDSVASFRLRRAAHPL
jgi:hypothetical protein